MRAPPLGRRITLGGIVVLATVLLVLDTFVFWNLRQALLQGLDELLDARVEVVVGLADDVHGADLADRLSRLAIPAEIRTAEGQVYESSPITPRSGGSPPTALLHPRVERIVPLPDGTVVRVFATRAGIDATMRQLGFTLLLGSIGAVALSAVLWRRASAGVLAPLHQMTVTAERITAGKAAQRLEPERVDTELGRLARAFDDMVDAQDRALADAEDERQRTRRFLADAAHQLRTPVAGLRASAEQLLQETDPETRDRLLSNVVRETARASRLVTALLRMAQLEQTGLRRGPVDLARLCDQEVERARGLAPHLDVQLVVPEGPTEPVDADPDALHDAIANLLDNARRHANTTVRVQLEQNDGAAVVRVRDDGPGVAPEDRERVFERFSSLDGRGGSGLGLPIARTVARAHGGDLAYESDEFVLRLAGRGPDAPLNAPTRRSTHGGRP